jgi:hypothetical protein
MSACSVGCCIVVLCLVVRTSDSRLPSRCLCLRSLLASCLFARDHVCPTSWLSSSLLLQRSLLACASSQRRHSWLSQPTFPPRRRSLRRALGFFDNVVARRSSHSRHFSRSFIATRLPFVDCRVLCVSALATTVALSRLSCHSHALFRRACAAFVACAALLPTSIYRRRHRCRRGARRLSTRFVFVAPVSLPLSSKRRYDRLPPRRLIAVGGPRLAPCRLSLRGSRRAWGVSPPPLIPTPLPRPTPSSSSSSTVITIRHRLVAIFDCCVNLESIT